MPQTGKKANLALVISRFLPRSDHRRAISLTPSSLPPAAKRILRSCASLPDRRHARSPMPRTIHLVHYSKISDHHQRTIQPHIPIAIPDAPGFFLPRQPASIPVTLGPLVPWSLNMVASAARARARDLVSWFESNGGQKSPAVELAEDEQHAFRFRALSDVDGNESPSKFNICSCPTTLSLSYLNIIPIEEKVLDGVSVRFCGSTLTSLWDVVPSHILSRFVLLEQASLKDRSFWAPYINALPTTFDTIIYFTTEDRKWLGATNLDTFRDIRHGLWKSEWELVMDALKERGIDCSQFSWDSYVWAASIFTSRGFDSTLVFPNLELERFSVLYPFLDSLNHDSNARVDWDMRFDAFALSTYEPLKKGDEIFNNYGSKGNEELLAGYGFCIPNNPFEQVAVKLGGLIPPIKQIILENHLLEPKDMSEEDFGRDLYLRSSDCKLGRYDNKHSWLGGIPPLLFKVALGIYLYTTSRPQSLHYDLPDWKPGRHIIGAVRQLLQVLQVRHQKIAGGAPNGEPTNTRQHYASVYRKGQLNVVDSNIAELRKVLPEFVDERSSILSPSSILTTREAIAQLETENPAAARAFVEGVGNVLVDPMDAAEMQAADCEDVVWVLWLAYAYVLTENTPSSKIYAWLHNLRAFYKSKLRDFAAGADQAYVPPAYEFVAEKIAEVARDVSGVWTACSERRDVIFWAAEVVQFEAWEVFVREDDKYGGAEGGRESRWVLLMDDEA
ncbi:SET domain-containing protein [Mytilinidion resinicola]|uniref:SET domain-containing protein n=1 Tax=Mytilinidion resinicola TaxID=574789 RepID=A0A6A6YU80_9PEZI|nr:SET domain-containing protein [Mytilinidion resinicola]KAF2812516.1 SET domain-containing protein [Mytilinidion resinicola]